jgi:site-specific DNA-methyltransferase (adenine-specific)
MIPFPDKKYAVIYADPPWDTRYTGGGFGCAAYWREGKLVNHKPSVSVELKYSTMTDKEIMELSVKGIVMDDALLFIWCIDSRIPILPELMTAWGFEFKTLAFIWHKTGQVSLTGENAPFGPLPRHSCEYCFMGKRGKWIGRNIDVRQFLNAPRREHSRKPDEIRGRIVELVGDVPRIELFARRRVAGWDAWGDELVDGASTIFSSRDISEDHGGGAP